MLVKATDCRQIVIARLHRPDLVASGRKGLLRIGLYTDICENRQTIFVQRNASCVVVIMAVSVVTGFYRQIHCIGMNEEQSDTGVIDIPVRKCSGSIPVHQLFIIEYGLHPIEQISTIYFISNKLPLTCLEIFRGKQAQILLPGGFAEEIFSYSGTTGYRRAVGKIKIVFIIYMHI